MDGEGCRSLLVSGQTKQVLEHSTFWIFNYKYHIDPDYPIILQIDILRIVYSQQILYECSSMSLIQKVPMTILIVQLVRIYELNEQIYIAHVSFVKHIYMFKLELFILLAITINSHINPGMTLTRYFLCFCWISCGNENLDAVFVFCGCNLADFNLFLFGFLFFSLVLVGVHEFFLLYSYEYILQIDFF